MRSFAVWCDGPLSLKTQTQTHRHRHRHRDTHRHTDSHTQTHTHRLTQRDSQRETHTERLTHRERLTHTDTHTDTNRETHTQRERDTHRETHTQRDTHRHRGRQRETHRERQIHTQRDTQRETHRETQRDTQRDTGTHRQTQRHRDRHTDTHRHTQTHTDTDRQTQTDTHRQTDSHTQTDRHTQTHTQTDNQASPDDNVALNIKGLDKNSMPETYAHAGRVELVSLPTHTASNPSTEKVLTLEMPHQRPDRGSPGGKVPLATEGSGKYTPGSGDETLHQQIDQACPCDKECAVNDTSKQRMELRTVEPDQGYDQIRLPSVDVAATITDCADGPLSAALEKCSTTTSRRGPGCRGPSAVGWPPRLALSTARD